MIRIEDEPGSEEGDRCNRDECEGHMRIKTDGNCSCHLSAPCSSCTNAWLECDICGASIYQED